MDLPRRRAGPTIAPVTGTQPPEEPREHRLASSSGDPRLAARFRVATAVAGTLAAALGAVVLVGWALEIETLKSVAPNWVTMKSNTAVCFILLGVALFLQRSRPSAGRSRAAMICSVGATLIGAATLIQYVFEWDLGIDMLLFSDPPGLTLTSHPGRMAPATALSFAIAGLSLSLLDGTRRHWASQLSALFVLLVAMTAVAGYLYGIEALYRVGPYTTMAMHTALGLAVLSGGILLARPDSGFMAPITGAGPGSVVLRRTIPAAIVVPLALGWLRLRGQRAGYYDTEFGLALMVLASTLLFSALALWTAGSLNAADARRRRAEEELRLTFAALNATANGVVITDGDGNIQWVNPAWTAITGYTPEETIGKNPRILKSGAQDDRYYAGLWQTIRSGRAWRGELINRRKDGSLYPEEETITPVMDETGKIIHFIAIKQDISARRRAEEALRDSEVRFRSLADDRRRLLSAFVAAQEEERARLANVVHDDSVQLMTAVGMRLGLLGDQVPAEARGNIAALEDTVQKAIERMRQLIFDLRPSALDQHGLVSALRDYLAHTFGAGPPKAVVEAELTVEPSGEVRTLLYRMTQEALANVKKHAEAKQVKVTLRTEQDGVLLEVTDDGVGFDAGAAPGAEPRGEQLGLVSLRERAGFAGGTFALTSAPGAGTTVAIWLPDTAEPRLPD